MPLTIELSQEEADLLLDLLRREATRMGEVASEMTPADSAEIAKLTSAAFVCGTLSARLEIAVSRISG